jgi:hypothetical protein
MQKKLRSRFYVTPKDGYGIDFDGVLIACDKGEAGYSVFVDVVAYPDQADAEKIKGEFYIMNGHVACSQLVS